jgi:hypothetical protein
MKKEGGSQGPEDGWTVHGEKGCPVLLELLPQRLPVGQEAFQALVGEGVLQELIQHLGGQGCTVRSDEHGLKHVAGVPE